MTVISTTLHKGYTVEVIVDEYAEGPRVDCDNLGTMVCWHRNYKLGDKHEFGQPADAMKHIKATGAVWLPLYLYDHSGITMNTTGFSCPWDSGQVGYIFVERDKILKEYGVKRITKAIREKVVDVLRAEVTEYDYHLTGQVYGYVVKKDGKTEESCWGFYGDEKYALEEGKSMAEGLANEAVKARLKKVKVLIRKRVPLEARACTA